MLPDPRFPRPSQVDPAECTVGERIVLIDISVERELATLELWRQTQSKIAWDKLVDKRTRLPGNAVEMHVDEYLTSLDYIWSRVETLSDEIGERGVRALTSLIMNANIYDDPAAFLETLLQERVWSIVLDEDV